MIKMSTIAHCCFHNSGLVQPTNHLDYYNQHEKQWGGSLKVNKLPHDHTVSLMGTLPKEVKSLCWTDTCSHIFIATLLIIPTSVCISRGLDKENMVYKHIVIL